MKHLTKRIISVVMTVCLLVSMLVVAVVPASAAEQTVINDTASYSSEWSGNTGSKTYEGVNYTDKYELSFDLSADKGANPDRTDLYAKFNFDGFELKVGVKVVDNANQATITLKYAGSQVGNVVVSNLGNTANYRITNDNGVVAVYCSNNAVIETTVDGYTATSAGDVSFSYFDDYRKISVSNIVMVAQNYTGEYVYVPKTVTLEPTGEYTSEGVATFKLPDGVTLYVGDTIKVPRVKTTIVHEASGTYYYGILYTDGWWWGQEGYTEFECHKADYTCETAGDKHLMCVTVNACDNNWDWKSVSSTVINFTVLPAPTEAPDAPEVPEVKDITLCWNKDIQKFVLPDGVQANVGDTLKFPAQPNLSTTKDETAVYGPIINVGAGWENWGQPWGAGWSYTVKEGLNRLYALSVHDIATNASVDTWIEILNINSGDIGTYVEPKDITLFWDAENNQFALPNGVTANVGDTLKMPASAPYFVGTEHSGIIMTIGIGYDNWNQWGQPWNGTPWSYTVKEGTNRFYAIGVYDPATATTTEIWEVAMEFESGTTGTYIPPEPPAPTPDPIEDTIELTEAWENMPLVKDDWYGDIESNVSWDPYGINNQGQFFHNQYYLGEKYIWTKQPYDLSKLDQFTVEAYLRMDTGYNNYYGEYCSLYLGDKQSNLEFRVSNIEGSRSYIASILNDGEVIATCNLGINVNGTYDLIYLDEQFYVTYEGVALTWTFADDAISKAITIDNLDVTSEQIGLRMHGNYCFDERFWTNVCLLPTVDDSFTKDDSISKIVRLEYNPNHGDDDYFIVPEGVQINVGDLLAFPEINDYNSYGFTGSMVNVGTEIATGDWQHSDKWGQPWGGYSSDKEYGRDGTGWYAKVTVAGQNHIYLYEMWDPALQKVVNVNKVICSFESYDDVLNTIPEGMCGQNVSWRIEDGTLYLEGTGATFGYNNVGWVNPFIEHRWNIQNIVVGDGITHLGARLFRGLNHTYTLTFGADVETMDYEVFYGMTKLTTINFNDKIKSIGALAFTDNLYMETIDIPASVTRINNRAFKNCDGLASITIPSTVKYLGHEVFYSCEALASVTFGATTDYINACMFQNCTSLESFTVPASIKEIRSNVFAGSGLKSIVFEDERAMRFNNNSTRMLTNVFDGCEGLTMTSYKNGYVEYYAGKHGFDFVAEGMLGERLVGTAGEYTLNKEIVATTEDAYAVHVGGEGVHVTIQGGIYDGGVNGTTNALIVTDNGAVTIADGLFKASGDVIRIVSGTVVITGGSFVDFDPTAYVAEGYTVETSVDGESTVYTVVAEVI